MEGQKMNLPTKGFFENAIIGFTKQKIHPLTNSG